MDMLQILKTELASISGGLRSEGVYFRLIMTDDIDNMANIRERAKGNLNHLGNLDKDSGFFHGLCISRDLQDRIDVLVRKNKPQLLEIISAGEATWKEYGLDVIVDKDQKAFLIIFIHCGAGFYLSERIHTPRHERRKRTSVQETIHRALMVPVAPKEAQRTPTGRKKKFTTIRHHVN